MDAHSECMILDANSEEIEKGMVTGKVSRMEKNHKNYQKEMEKIMEGLQGKRKSLLLHSCCAPCSSAVLEKLQEVFDITVFFYNPNISEKEEYDKRVEEQKRLIEAFNRRENFHPIKIREGDYERDRFYEAARGLEKCPEGGERCFKCYAFYSVWFIFSLFL